MFCIILKSTPSIVGRNVRSFPFFQSPLKFRPLPILDLLFGGSILMKCSLLLLLLLSLLCSSALALSEGEKSALQAILLNFSGLGSASPPWTANVASACTPPGFYGVSCSNDSDPHVIRMYEPSDISARLGSAFYSLYLHFKDANPS